ncbi:hypothetical protein HYE82_07265 [Streptomyces sp. BR123]|uniref:hypothetical protein n=1 Tax=Streptomyces sp. BR123 TaxID=2749828 RepID=UPI0015C41E0D|nr:hypothetical protein [Streptomyces sp. BR123]NXY94187.1 hypothetical protein [Streptomyces sp. BR123]
MRRARRGLRGPVGDRHRRTDIREAIRNAAIRNAAIRNAAIRNAGARTAAVARRPDRRTGPGKTAAADARTAPDPPGKARRNRSPAESGRQSDPAQVASRPVP